MKTGRLIFLYLLLAMGLPVSVAAEDSAALVWAFFLKDDSGQIRSLAFDQPERFAAGDLLRLYLQLQEKTYVYVYLYDSRQDLYLVFPPSPDFYADEFPAWRKFYIPSGRGWFTLDQGTGAERFYLLASPRRLFELEGLTEQFLLELGNPERQARLLAAVVQQAAILGETASLEQTPVVAPYASGQLGAGDQSVGSLANLTRASAGFSLVLDLTNH